MDYVYICRKGDNEELRYSIRSVVKNLPPGNIWVIGYKPKWYTGNFIPVRDTQYKFDNIKKCMSAIVSSDEISDDFVSMHDDFFITKKIDSIPVLHGGLLEDRVSLYQKLAPSSVYTRLLISTHKRLVKLGIPNPLDYDIHVPMVMNKTLLDKVLTMPYLERSNYGNIFGIGGSISNDVKVYSKGRMSSRSYDFLSGESYFLSTEDSSFEKILDMLIEMFPKPSVYESTAIGI
jgi:hypothetical protein